MDLLSECWGTSTFKGYPAITAASIILEEFDTETSDSGDLWRTAMRSEKASEALGYEG